MITIKDIDEIYEKIKPLNLGRKLIFQKYCEYLVENKQIEQSSVEKYLTKEFLYEDCDRSIDVFNKRLDSYNRDQKDLKEKNEREIEIAEMMKDLEGGEIKFHGVNNFLFNAVVVYAAYKLSKLFF